MKRETRARIIQTALMAHNAKHHMAVIATDELIERICDAEEEQDKRDAIELSEPEPSRPLTVEEEMAAWPPSTYAAVAAAEAVGRQNRHHRHSRRRRRCRIAWAVGGIIAGIMGVLWLMG